MSLPDVLTLMDQVKIIGTLATMAVTSGVVASIGTELLKWKFVLAPAKRWPKAVAAIMSVVSSLAAIAINGNLKLDNLATIVIVIIATFIAATQLYDKFLWKIYDAIKKI